LNYVFYIYYFNILFIVFNNNNPSFLIFLYSSKLRKENSINIKKNCLSHYFQKWNSFLISKISIYLFKIIVYLITFIFFWYKYILLLPYFLLYELSYKSWMNCLNYFLIFLSLFFKHWLREKVFLFWLIKQHICWYL
jgi:hypothetical protein